MTTVYVPTYEGKLVDVSSKPDVIQRTINEYAEDGWELVNVFPATYSHWLFFKRANGVKEFEAPEKPKTKKPVKA